MLTALCLCVLAASLSPSLGNEGVDNTTCVEGSCYTIRLDELEKKYASLQGFDAVTDRTIKELRALFDAAAKEFREVISSIKENLSVCCPDVTGPAMLKGILTSEDPDTDPTESSDVSEGPTTPGNMGDKDPMKGLTTTEQGDETSATPGGDEASTSSPAESNVETSVKNFTAKDVCNATVCEPPYKVSGLKQLNDTLYVICGHSRVIRVFNTTTCELLRNLTCNDSGPANPWQDITAVDTANGPVVYVIEKDSQSTHYIRMVTDDPANPGNCTTRYTIPSKTSVNGGATRLKSTTTGDILVLSGHVVYKFNLNESDIPKKFEIPAECTNPEDFLEPYGGTFVVLNAENKITLFEYDENSTSLTVARKSSANVNAELGDPKSIAQGPIGYIVYSRNPDIVALVNKDLTDVKPLVNSTTPPYNYRISSAIDNQLLAISNGAGFSIVGVYNPGQ